MKVLIPTEPDDTHAIVTKLALEDLGHQVISIFTADQPTRQKNSVFIDAQLYKWQISNEFNTIINDEYDVVWWRRARRPYLPKTITHPNDYDFVLRENSLFYESFTNNMAPKAWWINSKEAAEKADFKLLQLKVASECGMLIPKTLCSNDPKEIHDFITSNSDSGVIYKPLCSNFWFESNQIRMSYTSKVKKDDLPNNSTLQQAPGIFQKEIKKKYELRVTCFGDHIVAAKINSQEHSDGQVDWRAIRKSPIKVDEYKLPTNLEFKIRAFMREIGIVFGSFDFIVTNDNEYIFLEVNEQGQFLWIEELNANIRMLDTFINFILNKSPFFQWDENNLIHTIEKYRSRMKAIYDRNMDQHICVNNEKIKAWS
jgi:glutathione synthase/RimK-type ligase-like ATP-grasp enzyme